MEKGQSPQKDYTESIGLMFYQISLALIQLPHEVAHQQSEISPQFIFPALTRPVCCLTSLIFYYISSAYLADIPPCSNVTMRKCHT